MRRLGGYNQGMASDLFSEMKAIIAFSDDDAAALADLREPLAPHLPAVVEHFYEVLLRDDRARAILKASETRMGSLRQTLLRWLEELFSGCYDQDYYQHRCGIGRTHVKVNLPPSYMFTSMNVIRLDLVDRINRLDVPRAQRRIAAVHKILDLELAIMDETYREDMIRHIKEIERNQYQQKLSESQHLASVGQLAASLAHEIKNPLAGISGAIQVLGAGLPEDHPHKDIITEVLSQIDRLDLAVKDLLIYARPKPPERVRIDLSNTVDRAMILFRQEPAFRKVDLVCQGLDQEHIVEADETQIEQVITNLMLNAAHACKRGGHVCCRIEQPDTCVRVIIEDDGIGISPQVLARVFEPFFTTKAKGTGLGLPICKRIIKAHKGTLDIQSEVGRGTRVTFELPSQQ